MYVLPHIQYNDHIHNLIFLITNNSNTNNSNLIINISYNKYLDNILRYINVKTFNLYHITTSEYYNKKHDYLDLYYQMVEIIKINNNIINNNISNKVNIYHLNNLDSNIGYSDCIDNYNTEKQNNHYYHFADNNLNFYNRIPDIIENIRNNKEIINNNNLVIANYFNLTNKHKKYNNFLIYQLCIALTVQKFNGCLIFKIYNCYNLLICEIMYILSMLYKEVSLFKPTSCCYINGEIFIICKYFKLFNADKLVNTICGMINTNKITLKLLQFKVPYLFIKKIEEYNAIFGQNKIEIINISLIDNNVNKKEQLRLNYLKKICAFCKILNIKYLI